MLTIITFSVVVHEKNMFCSKRSMHSGEWFMKKNNDINALAFFLLLNFVNLGNNFEVYCYIYPNFPIYAPLPLHLNNSESHSYQIWLNLSK